HVLVAPVEELHMRLVLAVAPLAPDVLAVSREAFVEPALPPVAAGDEIAEPLVGELVRDEGLGVEVAPGARGEERLVGERRRGGVLHAAEDEFGDADLGVARVGVAHAEARREALEDLRGLAEEAPRVVLASGLDVVADRDVVPLVADLGELTGGEGHEVAGVRDVELPVVTLLAPR